MLLGEIAEPLLFGHRLGPVGLTHAEREGVLNGAEVGQCVAPDIFGVGGLAAAVGMEGGLDKVTVGVDDGDAAALHGAEHDVGPHAAVEVSLAVYMVAEVIAFLDVLVDVLQRPGARDGGLHTEDVSEIAVDFGLYDACDICLKLHLVDEQEGVLLGGGDDEVALVGALLDVGWVDAEDAGGVGGLEAHSVERAIVVAVGGDADLAAGGYNYYITKKRQ